MKRFLTILTFLTPLMITPLAFSETPQDQHFPIKGTITRVDAAAKVLYVNTEGGLELTFHTNEATQITVWEKPQSLTDLTANDEIEIDYFYNENYEKVARSIKKGSRPVSS